MFRVIRDASVMTDSSHNSWNMSYVQFSGGFQLPMPKHSFKVIIIGLYVISICSKYILTNKLLTQRGLPFSSPWEA